MKNAKKTKVRKTAKRVNAKNTAKKTVVKVVQFRPNSIWPAMNMTDNPDENQPHVIANFMGQIAIVRIRRSPGTRTGNKSDQGFFQNHIHGKVHAYLQKNPGIKMSKIKSIFGNTYYDFFNSRKDLFIKAENKTWSTVHELPAID